MRIILSMQVEIKVVVDAFGVIPRCLTTISAPDASSMNWQWSPHEED